MSTSILDDTKHQLGLLPDQTEFDTAIMIAINTAIANLTQLGVGPVEGYQITGPENVWGEFVDDVRLNSVKSYIYLTVALTFNPPNTGFMVSAMERQIQQLEFRINAVVDYG